MKKKRKGLWLLIILSIGFLLASMPACKNEKNAPFDGSVSVEDNWEDENVDQNGWT